VHRVSTHSLPPPVNILFLPENSPIYSTTGVGTIPAVIFFKTKSSLKKVITKNIASEIIPCQDSNISFIQFIPI